MRQNNITQQILARYLQKRLQNRAGGGNVQIGQPQLLPTGSNDFQGIQKNSVENLYAEEDDDGVIGDTQYYQGQTHYENASDYTIARYYN